MCEWQRCLCNMRVSHCSSNHHRQQPSNWLPNERQGSSSVPTTRMWNLSLTKWQSGKALYEFFGVSLSVSFHKWFISIPLSTTDAIRSYHWIASFSNTLKQETKYWRGQVASSTLSHFPFLGTNNSQHELQSFNSWQLLTWSNSSLIFVISV